jgi:hypothetical protein
MCTGSLEGFEVLLDIGKLKVRNAKLQWTVTVSRKPWLARLCSE